MRLENRIINNITAIDKDRRGNDFVLIELKAGEILFDSNVQWECVYFPIDCIISLSVKNDDGQFDGFALIGNEGMAGVSTLLGDTNNEYCAKVAHGGKAYRLSIDLAMKEVSQPSQFRILILCYMQALVANSLHMAICDSRHNTLERLCCALLVCDDRLLGRATQLDQRWLAEAIGATANELVEVICELNNEGFLVANQGQIAITNRLGLEIRSCECYRLIKNKFNQLLPVFNPQNQEIRRLPNVI